uniref:Uncharacterized protein n=1 Tax=Anopheles dirus TaxID=7168 RepID=A0A182NYG2_9DIPT
MCGEEKKHAHSHSRRKTSVRVKIGTVDKWKTEKLVSIANVCVLEQTQTKGRMFLITTQTPTTRTHTQTHTHTRTLIHTTIISYSTSIDKI